MTTEPTFEQMSRLIGAWTIEATHPAFAGLVVHGAAEISWLEGERFLIHRARMDHADFPHSISILGFMDRDRVEAPHGNHSKPAGEPRLCMHYFDSRGVFRVYEAGIDDTAWRLWRDAPGFSQKFTGRFIEGGDVIDGRWDLCEDDKNWEHDLAITYRRRR